MLIRTHRTMYGVGSSLMLLLTSCSGGDEPENVPVMGMSLQPEASGQSAKPVADTLWQYLQDQDYQSWSLLPGTTEKQPGASPHGAFVTIRYSGGDPAAASDGLILVKENFAEDAQTLGAVTVMLKASSFDPQNRDWFYAKYLPDGSLDMAPNGMPLAGAVEPAPGMACRGCHRDAPGEDFQYL